MNPTTLTVTGKLRPSRRRSSARTVVAQRPQVPTRVARMLALAHHLERFVESGKLTSYADAARKLGLTRARMSQIVSLLNLSPDIQESILSGTVRASERRLRAATRMPNWAEQDLAIRAYGPDTSAERAIC